MIDRQQVNLRLERELISSLDDLATKESVDRTEMARRILVDGIARARIDRAIRDYAQEKVTASKAAEDAGISLYEMLDRIHEARIPYELDGSDWAKTNARVIGRQTKVAEGAAEYHATSADLANSFKPSQVRVLFVGESSPAEGAHFYRANSNLYRATRAAFAAVFGEDVVPSGEAFLRYFQDQGCWLVDLADRPVNQLSDSKRRQAIADGVEGLAKIIGDTEPASVLTVKRDIVDAVEDAVGRADSHAEVVALPFPVRQWTREYQALLEDFLSENLAD